MESKGKNSFMISLIHLRDKIVSESIHSCLSQSRASAGHKGYFILDENDFVLLVGC